MASFFGEVLLPVSRAFWEDDEECEPTEISENQPDFTVQWLKEKPTNIKSLLVVDSAVLMEFTKECLCPKSEEVCFIKNERGENLSVFYEISTAVYLCTISPKFDVKFCGRLIEQMSDILQTAENIICLTHQHISKFQKDNISETHLIRQLCTKKAGNICSYQAKPLEQPNIIFGFTAGVLSYAEFMGLSSVLYILYTENFTLDSISVEPLIKLFTAMDYAPHGVTFSGSSFFSKGNLYM